MNNSFFKHYLRIESYNFMQKFSRQSCVVYFKNMFEFLNHSKFSKGCVARSLYPIFTTPQTHTVKRLIEPHGALLEVLRYITNII